MTLAEDLVTAAKSALALAAVEGRLPSTRGPLPFDSIAQVAVVAVLKRLAARPDGFLRHQEDGGITYTRTLRELAQDIEARGGTTQAGTP